MPTSRPDPGAAGAADTEGADAPALLDPPPDARVAPGRPRPRPSLWWLLGPLLFLVGVGVVTAGFARAPYVMFAPGSARATEPRITVPKNLNHDDPGEVMFTTVSVIRPTYLQALWGWLRSDTDVYSYKAIYGDQTPTQNRVQGQSDMRSSKLVAAKVALEQLGYPVKVQGTGVTLTGVEATLPAGKVLRAGDVVVGADGKVVRIDTDLVDAIAKHRAGDDITLTIEPAGARARRTVTVALGRRSGTAADPVLGVVLETRGLRFELPFPVGIDSGSVGGPSAGLGFTLGVLDKLTPGSITGGRKVAVTGAMSPEGRVLEVGGVAQKVVAARRAGAELFIVPTGEYAEARTHAGGLRVVKVDTLAGALRVLASIGGNADRLGKPGATG